ASPRDAKDKEPYYAGKCLVDFGEAGCTALIELCRDPNPQVRLAAMTSLSSCLDPRVEDALKALQNDPDQAVRDSVALHLKALRLSQRSARQ
ncbi:MAG TPA: HEAT repeat domain-containing protein, partial [Candidatus Sulfotelmatobacter sp.]|nr:HEAT repeat domain-containing protein [Candidatus Sulfotelmatobacter sp.]